MARLFVRLAFTAALLAVASAASAQEFKVKLQGSVQDRKTFLEKLNDNGKEHGVSFVETESGFTYRMAIYSESVKASDMLFGGGADASAAILDNNCEVLFIVTRGGRASKGGATNALSKELVKKFKQMGASR